MAWIQNLTGQAEKLLNKIDQKAAIVLNDGNHKKGFSQSLDACNSEMNETTDTLIYLQEEPILNIKHNSEDLQELHDYGIEEESINELNVSESQKDRSPDSIIDLALNSPIKTSSNSSCSESALTCSSSVDAQKYLEKISKLEFENNNLNSQLLNIQHLYSEIRNENITIKNNLERAYQMVNMAEDEMEQYKARTHRILLEKEKLISLRDNGLQDVSTDSLYVNCNEDLKKELDFQQNEIERYKEKIANLSSEVISLQQQYVVMQNTYQQSIHKLEIDLLNEKKMFSTLNEEFKSHSDELSNYKQEVQYKNNDISTKNRQIEEFKSQLKHYSSMVNNEDLDKRFQKLNQILIKKQNTLESITTERNALKIQLEKLENEYAKNLSLVRSSQQKAIHVNDTDDVKLQIPQILRVTPLDAGVTRRMKHAYSSLDALSIRTGVFLRRYPVVRVFVFSYMVLMHLWVLFVLWNDTPTVK